MFYIVHFHADGGQACVDGIRCYPQAEKDKAEEFAERMRNEPGHHCLNSVRIEEAEAAVPDKGRVIRPASITVVSPQKVVFKMG